MNLLIQTDILDYNFYKQWIKNNINNKLNLCLIGNNINNFLIKDNRIKYTIFTKSIDLDFKDIYIIELNIYNNNYQQFIKINKCIKIFETNNCIGYISNYIDKINILLNDKYYPSTLSKYNQILTENGIIPYQLNKEYYYYDLHEYMINLGYIWTEQQKNIAENMVFYKDLSLNINELYQYYCLNCEQLKLLYKHKYYTNKDKLNFYYNHHDIRTIELTSPEIFCNQLKFYSPLFFCDNFIIDNEYSYVNLQDNEKILGFHLDKNTGQAIQLIIPNQFIDIFNLTNYQKYNDNYSIITTNNPVDIFLMIQLEALNIYIHLASSIDKFKPNQGIIYVPNN